MLSADSNSELECTLVPRPHENVKSIDILAPPGPSEQPFPGVARRISARLNTQTT